MAGQKKARKSAKGAKAASAAKSRSKRRARTSATAVGAFVPGITRKAFEKFGFSTAAILTDWPAIIGRELAAFTAPEKINWPRPVKASGAERDEADCLANPNRGATLILRVAGARALEVQHRVPQVLERINAYFGYRAVSELRLLQAPVVAMRMPRAASATPRSVLGPVPVPAVAPPRSGALGGKEEAPIQARAIQPRMRLAGKASHQVAPENLTAALDRMAAGLGRRLQQSVAQ